MTKEEAIRQIKEEIAAFKKTFTIEADYFIRGYKAGMINVLDIIGQIDVGWHTEKPKEKGWYLLAMKEGYLPFAIGEYDGTAFDIDTDTETDEIIAWQKIEPYKEEK